MKSSLQRPGRQQPPVVRPGSRRGVTLLVAVALLASSVFALRGIWQGAVVKNDADAPATGGLTSWGAQPGARSTLSETQRPEASAAGSAGETSNGLPAADNSSEIDGAPPVPIEATAASSTPMTTWRTLAPEHMPEAPARARSPEVPQDGATLRQRVETLLVADPEALQQARDLLNEPDPEIRARNLQILSDSFGLD